MLASSLDTRFPNSEYEHSTTLMPPILNGMPFLCEAQSQGHHGFALDFDFNVALIARYESIERATSHHHSRPEEPPLKLGDLPEQFIADSLKLCLSQTRKANAPNIDSYFFDIETCVNVITGKATKLPKVIIGLGPQTKDNVFMPEYDTSGSATHTDSQKCLEAAVLEFVERQCLCLNWCSKKPVRQLTLSGYDKRLGRVAKIIDQLSSDGIVRIIDISKPFASYNFLAVYSAHKWSKSEVKFSCGLSGALTVERALEKCIIELYQGYYHMSLMLKNPPAEADYLNYNYYSANAIETGAEFGYANEVDLDFLLGRPKITLQELVGSISNVTCNLFYAHSMHCVDGTEFMTGKIFSPDMYINLSLNSYCNLQNKLSSYMNVEYKPVPPIPFG